ncbi:hypothetical protein GI584_11410 [Gracilibacillus salitolerans]|uniref:Uncharacterized protein n=1 Tax=Gracilibacillus salitolerans TaxID=2663022 RepID=A0A5Q2TKJ9_9BACI|nr:hypothetical protein [Gracilibacillus salitolerans]QGH34602.1 hypothetical protein GI584_11410 [Gracilibacillus salitolerans]
MKNNFLFFLFVFLLALVACSVENKSIFNEENDATESVSESNYSNSKTTQEIDDAITKIISYPSKSSNPNDYITENQKEFDFIVSKEGLSLNYLIKQFEASKTDGLKEQIMASACVVILGEMNPVDNWSSGREWYEEYINDNNL